MKSKEFIKQLQLAVNSKTLYVMGGLGYRLTDKGKKRALKKSYNAKPDRTAMINAATDDTWAFDCNCLIKSIIWGWNKDPNGTYGGAVYKSNDMLDASIVYIVNNYLTDVSKDFNEHNMTPGEYLFYEDYGHAGVYIGNGEVIECTPAFKNCVQITKLSQRKWYGHGKLKQIDYSDQAKKQITKEELLLAIDALKQLVLEKED